MDSILVWGLIGVLMFLASGAGMVAGVAFAIAEKAEDKWIVGLGTAAFGIQLIGLAGIVIVVKDLL